MKKKISRVLLITALCGICMVLYLVFSPRTYPVASIQPWTHMQYWNLATGSRIAYTLVSPKGTKKPFPVIFLQGGPGGFISGRNVAVLGQLAEDGYDVYLYDQIGSGHSDRLNDIKEYTADRHKRDLEEIVKLVNTGKVILIGQSWGAILSTLFVADNPGKVAKLVVTGPGPIVPVRYELAAIKAPDSLHLKEATYSNREANEQAANTRSKATELCARWFGRKLTPDKEADDFQTYLNDGLNRSTLADTSKAEKAEGGGGYYVQVMTVKSFADTKDPRPALKGCKVPLLIMRGEFDNQKWGYTTEYLELFPDHRLVVIPGAGHSIAREQPVMYQNTIRTFLNN